MDATNNRNSESPRDPNERTDSGGIRPSPSDWADVPESDRPAWMRYMVEYPPHFPGPTFMNLIARAVLGGKTDVIASWSRFAAAMHTVGFAPIDYYLLCQDLSIRHLQGNPAEERRPDLFRVDPTPPGAMVFDLKTGEAVTPEPRYVVVPEKWANWPLHVRLGRTPRRATEWVLTDGAPHPISVHVTGSDPTEYLD